MSWREGGGVLSVTTGMMDSTPAHGPRGGKGRDSSRGMYAMDQQPAPWLSAAAGLLLGGRLGEVDCLGEVTDGRE